MKVTKRKVILGICVLAFLVTVLFAVVLITPGTKTWWKISFSRLETIARGVKGFVDVNGWKVLVLLLCILFFEPLRSIATAIAETIGLRGITLDVKGVKVELTEPPFEWGIDLVRAGAQSPFEIQGTAILDDPAALRDFDPQIQFSVGDYTGQDWVKSSGGAGTDTALAAQRALLEQACAGNAPAAVRTALDGFASALEKSRFLSTELLKLIKSSECLGSVIATINASSTPNDKDRLVRHCLAVTYAQAGEWEKGETVLESIVLPSSGAPYFWAADIYLACHYNRFVDSQTTDQGTPTFDANVTKLDGEIQKVAAAEQWQWNASLGIQKANVAYYKREFHKTMGIILSMIADIADPSKRDEFLTRARPHLEASAAPIDEEPPSQLDLNNLADLYRQMQLYVEAEATISAPNVHGAIDPIFDEVRAKLEWDQTRPWKALEVLESRTAEAASLAGSAQLVEYVNNRILAAKMLYNMPNMGKEHRVSRVLTVLEQTRLLVEAKRTQLGTDTAKLLATLDEMLGVAYLHMPGAEAESVAAFARVSDVPGTPWPRVWTRMVWDARARIRLSRQLRRRRAPLEASARRVEAEQRLAQSGDVLTKITLLDGSSVWRQAKYVLLQLDTVVANLELAEEQLYQGELASARAVLLGIVDQVLQRLELVMGNPAVQTALGKRWEESRSNLRAYQARKAFCLGRICIRQDSAPADEKVVGKADGYFAQARGVGKEQTCWVDLERGRFLLDAACRGTGDVEAWYAQSLAALENALRSDDPALRNEASQTLAQAYGARPRLQARRRKLRKAEA